MSALSTSTREPARAPRTLRRPSLRAVIPTRGGRIGVLLLGVLIAAAVLAPWIAPDSPDHIVTSQVLRGLSPAHPFGSDDVGRDVLTRVLYGFRISLVVAGGSILLSFPIGAAVGVCAGYFGGFVESALMRPVEMLMAFPALLLGLTLITIMGPGTGVTIIAIALIYIPVFSRVVRSTTRVVRNELYVQAAIVRGASTGQVLLRHVVPNSLGPALVQATVLAGISVQIEAAFSYLGLGVQPPTPSLGGMLAEGQDFVTQAPWIEIFPGLALAITVLAFNLVGDALRHRLDPGGLSR
jgi:peptide/nickel transport system permease protein